MSVSINEQASKQCMKYLWKNFVSESYVIQELPSQEKKEMYSSLGTLQTILG